MGGNIQVDFVNLVTPYMFRLSSPRWVIFSFNRQYLDYSDHMVRPGVAQEGLVGGGGGGKRR